MLSRCKVALPLINLEVMNIFVFFLVLLVTGIIAGYFSINCSDEIGSLLGLLSAISLLISLVFSPWQVQLLLLMHLIIKH